MAEGELEDMVVGVLLEVLLLLILSLWDMLFSDFNKNTLMTKNWLPTDGRTHPYRDARTRLKIWTVWVSNVIIMSLSLDIMAQSQSK